MAVDIGGLISVIIFYSIILLVGIWAAKKTKQAKTKDLITAGRSLGLGVGVFTLTASWVGGGYINGAAEIIYSKGMLWCQVSVGYTLSMFVGGLFFAKQARAKNYVTMLDPLQEAFGLKMGTLLYLPVFIGEVFWCATTLAALGTSLSILLGWNSVMAIIASASLATLYTLIGGLWAVAYTDIIQFIITFLGLYICIPFVWNHKSFDTTKLTTNDWLGTVQPEYIASYIDLLLMIIFGGIPWQAFFQRILAAKTPNQARTMSLLSAGCCCFFAIPAILLGIVGKTADWSKTSYKGSIPISAKDSQFILPLILLHMTPYFISIVAIGTISAAIISSADSSILGAASLFTWNMYKLTLRPRASEREIIWAHRISILAVGVVAAGVAIKAETIYGLVYLCSDLIYVILFPQLLGVFHFPSYCNVYGSFFGYVISAILRIGAGEELLHLPPLIKYPGYSEKNGQLFPYRTFSMLIGLIVLVFVSALTHWLFRKDILSEKWNILDYDFANNRVRQRQNGGESISVRSSGDGEEDDETLEPDPESRTMLEEEEAKNMFVHANFNSKASNGIRITLISNNNKQINDVT